MNRKVLVLVTNPEDNLAEIRLGQPLRALAGAQGWSVRMLAFFEVSRLDLRWADVVVFQRPMRSREAHLMSWLVAQGIPVIYEIDDLLTEPADHVMGAADLRAHADLVRQMLGMADAVSASTPRLVERLGPLAKSIHLVPNYGPGEQLAHARHDDAAPVTLLIAASDRQAVGPMAEGIGIIQADRSLRVDILAIATIADSLEEAGVTCRRLPKLPREEFFRTLASLANPIGLIPLDDSRFSGCKSAVKFFDYACLGIPSICSNHPPYADVISHGHDGLLCEDSATSWSDAIRRLASDARVRESMADAARRKVVEQHSLSRTVASWSSLLTGLIDGSATRRHPVSSMQKLSDTVVTQFQQMRGAVTRWNHQRLKNRQVRPIETQRP